MIFDNVQDFILMERITRTNDIKYLLDLSRYIEGYMTNPVEHHDFYGELKCRTIKLQSREQIENYFHEMSLWGHVFLYHLSMEDRGLYDVIYCYKLDDKKYNMFKSLRNASMQNEIRLTDAYEDGKISYEVYVHLVVKNFTLLAKRNDS